MCVRLSWLSKGAPVLLQNESGVGERESGVGGRESGVGGRESGVGGRESPNSLD